MTSVTRSGMTHVHAKIAVGEGDERVNEETSDLYRILGHRRGQAAATRLVGRLRRRPLLGPGCEGVAVPLVGQQGGEFGQRLLG
jgi:hypothetical protein